MKKERSIYTFQLNCDPSLANYLIQSYMKANKYSLQSKNGEQFYRAGDSISGFTYFKYSISGQTLTIYAWLKGILGPISLDKNNFNMSAISYKNSLNTLFEEIDKLNNSEEINTQEVIQNNIDEFSKTFQDEIIEKQERMCEIGFWISILGFFTSLLGVMYSGLLYFVSFYLSSQGLKNRKKRKALSAIVLSIISLIILFLKSTILSAL